jgi:hypothetical protein
MARYALAWAIAAALGAATTAAQKIDLDLTTATRPVPSAETGGEHERTVSVGGGQSSHQNAAAPVRVRLLHMPPKCEVGDPIVFDVELQNVSRDTLTLPWSLDPANQGRSDSPLVFPIMRLALRLSRPDVPEAVDGGDALYGNPSDPFTIRALAPQERVVIRGSAVCNTINHRDERLSRRGAHAFRIYAVVSMGHSATTFGRSIESNSFPVEITYSDHVP